MKLKGKFIIVIFQEKYKGCQCHNIDEKYKNKSFEQKEGLRKINGYVKALLTN